MTTCDAAVRPFPNETEIRCELETDDHAGHQGTLRDYAYPGSATTVVWAETDRRTYHGEWPGACKLSWNTTKAVLRTAIEGPCVLPNGHRGECAR